MTGSWELRLRRMERGEEHFDAFMRDTEDYVREVVRTVAETAPAARPPGGNFARRGEGIVLPRPTAQNGRAQPSLRSSAYPIRVPASLTRRPSADPAASAPARAGSRARPAKAGATPADPAASTPARAGSRARQAKAGATPADPAASAPARAGSCARQAMPEATLQSFAPPSPTAPPRAAAEARTPARRTAREPFASIERQLASSVRRQWAHRPCRRSAPPRAVYPSCCANVLASRRFGRTSRPSAKP